MRFKDVIVLIIIFSGVFTFAEEKKKDPLKAPLHFIQGLEEYRLLVKFRPALDPVLDKRGNLTLLYTSPTESVLEPILKYNLTFSYVAMYSEKDLEILQSPKNRCIPDEKGYNVYDFAGLLYVHSPTNTKEKLLEIGTELQKLEQVEYCELQPLKQPPAPEDYSPTTEDLSSYQDYRGPDPGLDVDYAWNLGLRGAGLTICDEEYSWGPLDHANKNIHEDLHNQDISYGLPYQSGNSSSDHGQAVVGLLFSGENGYGINGSVPEARGLVFPERINGTSQRTASFIAATDSINKGDFILMEMQTYGPDNKYCPSDYSTSLWDAVKAATEVGVVVVQCAGNGGANLDGSNYADYRARGDNESIVEGAGTSDTDHDKLSFSTYGSENVYVQGWGQNVVTISFSSWKIYGNDENQQYTNSFSGTSSGGPIVTSAAALVQSYAKEFCDTLLSSVYIRDVLVATGIPQGQATASTHIGPFPNIKAAIELLDSVFVTKTSEKINKKVTTNGLYQYNSKIRYFVPASDVSHPFVSIKLYTVKGSLIATLVNEQKSAGIYGADIKHINNKTLAAGLYLCQMEVMKTKRTIRIRLP